RSGLTRRSRYSQKVFVNSGCASRRSMMRRSGVRPVVCRSNTSCAMPRRAASGHRPAMQLEKLAAAARIAWRVISGLPEAPSSPLHSVVVDAVVAAAGGGAFDGLGANSERRSNWAEAAADEPTSTATAQNSLGAKDVIGMLACLLH